MASQITRLGTVLLGGLFIVSLALGYWQVLAAPSLIVSPANPRPALEASRVIRGQILDRLGTVLAGNAEGTAGHRRVYPVPSAAPVTGYTSARFGSAGVELAFNDYLSGSRPPGLLDRLKGRLLHTDRRGSDVVLTIDARLQEVATEVMGGSAGALVALDPRTGAVLALVSTPFVDPNELEDRWAKLAQDPAKPFFNRALQALYTPGSTFKIVTATAAVDLGLVNLAEAFTCSRPVTIERLTVDCRNNAHVPRLTFKEAFAWSSNRTFALAGLALGFEGPINGWLSDQPPGPYPWQASGISESAARLEEYARRFGFERSIPFDLPVSVSRLKSQQEWTPDLLGQTAFGQGQLAETPLLVALAGAAIANGGYLPEPYLVSEVRAPDGSVTAVHQPARSLGTVMRPETARTLNEFMVESVAHGYAGKAAIAGVTVAGKTGTAEVGGGQTPHSWFVGYAPAEDPLVVVAVVMEHRGSGSDFATPAAQRVLAEALRLYRR